jgi:hypothetical protein
MAYIRTRERKDGRPYHSVYWREGGRKGKQQSQTVAQFLSTHIDRLTGVEKGNSATGPTATDSRSWPRTRRSIPSQ